MYRSDERVALGYETRLKACIESPWKLITITFIQRVIIANKKERKKRKSLFCRGGLIIYPPGEFVSKASLKPTSNRNEFHATPSYTLYNATR